MPLSRRHVIAGLSAAALVGAGGYVVVQRRHPPMSALLQRLDTVLRTSHPGYYASLAPGTSASELDAYERQFGLKLPADLRMFWQWKNGTTDTLPETPVLDQMLMSVAGSAAAKEMMDGMIGTDFTSPDWWLRSWVPFSENGAGDHYCVETSPRQLSQPGGIIDFWHDDATRNVVAPSLRAWLSDLLATLESGESQSNAG